MVKGVIGVEIELELHTFAPQRYGLVKARVEIYKARTIHLVSSEVAKCQVRGPGECRRIKPVRQSLRIADFTHAIRALSRTRKPDVVVVNAEIERIAGLRSYHTGDLPTTQHGSRRVVAAVVHEWQGVCIVCTKDMPAIVS